MSAIALIALAGCDIPSKLDIASDMPSKTDTAAVDAPCDPIILSRETRDNLKDAIVRSVKHNEESYADRPDFFSEYTVILGFAELRPDHRDLVVYVSGPRYCGTSGCGGFIFQDKTVDPAKPEYGLLSRIRPARLPITALKSSHNGWADVGVAVAGGGIMTPYTGALSFDGTSYNSNPTLMDVPHVSDDDVKAIIIGDPEKGSSQCRLS